MTDLPETIIAADLARLLGLTANRVSVLGAEGVLERRERGRYALVSSVQRYCEWCRDNPRGRKGVSTEGKDRLTAAQADLAELKLAQTRGELLHLEDVRREWAAIAIDLRARLLSIAPRVGSALGLDRATAARLDSELRSALEDLADQRDAEIEDLLS